MIDRTLLKDIGFKVGTGWDHEVWIYDGFFWVHYGGKPQSGFDEVRISGDRANRVYLFRMLIPALEIEARERAVIP
jgi:hypothetical protein